MLKEYSPREKELPAIWNRRGSALPVVMLVILVLSLLGSGLLSLTLGEGRGAANDVQINQATYLAEAGINLALANLRRDPGWQGGLGQTSLTGVQGYIQGVNISQQVLSYRLRSLARVGGVQRAVEVDLARPLYNFALATAGDLDKHDQLIIAGGDVLALGNINNLRIVYNEDNIVNVAAGGNLAVNGTLQGNAIAGGDLYVNGTIKGDATAGGVIYNNGKIYGNKSQGVSLSFPTFPEHPEGPYASGSLLEQDTYTVAAIQAMVNDTDRTPAILYRQGDLTITAGDADGNSNGNDNGKGHGNGNGNNHGTTPYSYNGIAIIAASGSITLDTSLEPASSGRDAWAFIAGGDLNISGGTTLEGVFIDGGTISKNDRGKESNINGCLVTRYVGAIDEDKDHQIKGKIRITYDQKLVRSLAPYLSHGNWPILSWREAALQ